MSLMLAAQMSHEGHLPLLLAYLVRVQEREAKAREQREAERLKKIREIREAEKKASTADTTSNNAHWV